MKDSPCSCTTSLDPEPDLPSRRSVLGWIVTVINLAVLAALAIPGIRFIAAPLGRRSVAQWADVLGDAELAEGETREAAYSMKVQDGYQAVTRKFTVYLYRDASGIKCFDPACTHLGCRIKFQNDQRRYFCPCHGGVFAEDGHVVSGPPPKGLVEHPVKVEDGRILVSRQV